MLPKRVAEPDSFRWDVVIIGGGPGGLSAAGVLARMGRRVVVIDEGKQRNLASAGMHNFPTREGMLPKDFLRLSHEELEGYGVSFLLQRAVAARQVPDYHFEVTDADGCTHSARRLLLATGVSDNIPDIPGMHELWGSAIHQCPYCDGWECRDHTMGLYAQRINGYGMSLALGCLTKKLTLFTDGARYLRKAQAVQLAARGVRVVVAPIERLIHEDGALKSVRLRTGEDVPCDKMFLNHGFRINGDLLDALGCRRTKSGAAVTNRKQQTSVPGVYAAGDADLDIHFVIVACAEGAKAGVAIHTDMMHWDEREALALTDSAIKESAAANAE